MGCLFPFRIFFFTETFCFEAQAARDQIAIPQKVGKNISPTWRMGSQWMVQWLYNNHGDPKSPEDRVVGPLPNGLFMAYTWG